MNTTRACTVQDLGLMRLEDALKWIAGKHEWKDIGIDILGLLRSKNFTIQIPAKSYAVSVVERNKNTKEVVDLVKYNSQFNTLSFYRKSDTGSGWDTLNTIYHTTNPFEGLTNADGTPRTSATRDEIEQWRREERG